MGCSRGFREGASEFEEECECSAGKLEPGALLRSARKALPFEQVLGLLSGL